MTDRVYALSVVLEKDMRDDDVEAVVNAILMIRNVLSVSTRVKSVDEWAMYERARSELYNKMVDILRVQG